MSSPAPNTRQPRRVPMACTWCRRRKIRCEPQPEFQGQPCRNCLEKGRQCVYVPVEQDEYAANQQFASPIQDASLTLPPNQYVVYGSEPFDGTHGSIWSGQASPPANQAQSPPTGLPGYSMPNSGRPSSYLNDSTVAYPASGHSWPNHTSSMHTSDATGSSYYYPQSQNSQFHGGDQSTASSYGIHSSSAHGSPVTYCDCVVGYECLCRPGYACQCPYARRYV